MWHLCKNCILVGLNVDTIVRTNNHNNCSDYCGSDFYLSLFKVYNSLKHVQLFYKLDRKKFSLLKYFQIYYQLDHKTPRVPTWSWETLPGEEGLQTIILVKYLEIFQIYIYILNVSKYILPTFMEQSWQENVASNIMNISYFTNLILRNNTGGGGGVLTISVGKMEILCIYLHIFRIFPNILPLDIFS